MSVCIYIYIYIYIYYIILYYIILYIIIFLQFFFRETSSKARIVASTALGNSFHHKRKPSVASMMQMDL